MWPDWKKRKEKMATARQCSSKTEYNFCKVCKRNHSDGRKHIYYKRHKEKLDIILKKFVNKVLQKLQGLYYIIIRSIEVLIRKLFRSMKPECCSKSHLLLMVNLNQVVRCGVTAVTRRLLSM